MNLTDIKVFIYHLPDFVMKFDFWRKRRIKKYLESHNETKLQIGCGGNLLFEWLNTDISLHICRRGAIYMDAGKPFPLPDRSIDYIYSEHIFEHLTEEQGLCMLKECRRVLKKDGVVRLATPNFCFLLDLYNNAQDPLINEYILWSTRTFLGTDTLFSPIFVINNFHTNWGHRIIYDFHTLKSQFLKAGFNNVYLCNIGESRYKAFLNIEHHQYCIPAKFNELETMVVEAKF